MRLATSSVIIVKPMIELHAFVSSVIISTVIISDMTVSHVISWPVILSHEAYRM